MSHRTARVVLPSLVGVGVLLVGSPAANAAALSASGTGVSGTGDVTWYDAYYAKPVSLKVCDTKGDGHDVYGQYISYYLGGQFETQERRNNNGNGTCVAWTGLYIHDARMITGVRLKVCVDDFGGDTCYTSSYLDNPYT